MKNVLLNRAFSASPTNTAYVSGAVGSGTNTPASGDTGLQTILANLQGSSSYKGYESGFPSFDTTNRRVSTRLFVPSTQLNSQNISEYGDFNGDSGPKIGGRFVFTAIAKTSSIQLFIKSTYRMI